MIAKKGVFFCVLTVSFSIFLGASINDMAMTKIVTSMEVENVKLRKALHDSERKLDRASLLISYVLEGIGPKIELLEQRIGERNEWLSKSGLISGRKNVEGIMSRDAAVIEAGRAMSGNENVRH